MNSTAVHWRWWAERHLRLTDLKLTGSSEREAIITLETDGALEGRPTPSTSLGRLGRVCETGRGRRRRTADLGGRRGAGWLHVEQSEEGGGRATLAESVRWQGEAGPSV